MFPAKASGFAPAKLQGFSAASAFAFSPFQGLVGAAQNLRFGVRVVCNTRTLSPTGDSPC